MTRPCSLLFALLLLRVSRLPTLRVYRSREGNSSGLYLQFQDKVVPVLRPEAIEMLSRTVSPEEISSLMLTNSWRTLTDKETSYIQPDNFTRGLFTRIQVLQWLSSPSSLDMELSFIGRYFNPSVVYWRDKLFMTSRKVNDTRRQRHFAGNFLNNRRLTEQSRQHLLLHLAEPLPRSSRRSVSSLRCIRWNQQHLAPVAGTRWPHYHSQLK